MLVSHFISEPAYAASYTWTGATSTLWSAAGNWSPSGPPSNGDSVTFPAGASNTSTVDDISGLSLAGITFSSPNTSTSYFITGTNTLTLTGNVQVNSGVTSSIQIDAPLSGGGGIVMNGSGVLTLTNTSNNFSGASTLSAGSISAASHSLGTGTLALAGGALQGNGASATLSNGIAVSSPSTVGGSVNLTLSGIISGSSSLSQNGTMTLTLSGNNSAFTGGFANNSSTGTTVLGNANALGTAAATFTSGSQLQASVSSLIIPNTLTFGSSTTVDGPCDLTLSGTVTATSGFIKAGTNTLTLSGPNSLGGNLSINSGTLAFSNPSALSSAVLSLGGGTLQPTASMSVSNTIALSGAGTVNFGSNTVILSGNVSGSGSLTVTGAAPGTLTLSGPTSYTGATTVNGGGLLVNTTLTTSAITVNSGGVVSGTGSLGSVTVNSGGTLSPSIGVSGLTAQNVTFASGSVFFEGISGTAPNAAGGYAQLTVTGTVTLNNPILSVQVVFTPSVGQTFTLINGTVTGTFNGIPNGGTYSTTNATFTVNYSSVILTVQSASGTTATPTTVPTFSPTAVATVTPTATPTPASSGGGSSSSSSPSGSTIAGSTTIAPAAQQALGNVGLGNVVIPPVPPPGAQAAPADVPVPLAALNPGSLVLPLNTALTTQVLSQVVTAPAPVAVSAAVNTSRGGIIVAGNTAIVLPASAFNIPAPQPGQLFVAPVVQVAVQPQPAGVPIPGGPAQFSPNGTVLDIKFTDQSTGKPITTFANPVQLTFRPNAADISQSGNHPETLTAAYVIDAQSPAIENPLGFPIGTFVIFPPSNVVNDTHTGTITVSTQALGSTVAVVTNPVGYVQTLGDNAPVASSFDPNTSQEFGTKPQFSYLQVVEPQIGNRLLVLDPDTGNYGYVNAADVGPSGPPPPKTSTAVVRGLLGPPPKPPAGPPPASVPR